MGNLGSQQQQFVLFFIVVYAETLYPYLPFTFTKIYKLLFQDSDFHIYLPMWPTLCVHKSCDHLVIM